MVKNLPANAGDMGSILGLGRSPGEGNGNPLQYSCHEQRSLAGYSLLCFRESDTTKHARSSHFHSSTWALVLSSDHLPFLNMEPVFFFLLSSEVPCRIKNDFFLRMVVSLTLTVRM